MESEGVLRVASQYPVSRDPDLTIAQYNDLHGWNGVLSTW